MQVIEIISLSGHSPFNISICDITRTYCYIVSTGVVSAPITVEIPTELSGTQELLVVITDDAGCETFSYYNCFTPTPTPTLTPTPTITPTNISCNCITFKNTGTTSGDYTYIDCYGQYVEFTINSGTTLYVCGKSPSSSSPVTYSMGLPCANNTCVLPTPTPTHTPTSSPVVVDCVSYIMTGSTEIFKYNIDTNVLTLLTFPVQPLVSDIANNSNKFWITDIYNPQQLIEYYLSPNPFSVTYNRTLYPTQPLLGLCVKNSDALISTITGVTAGDSYIVVEVDIATSVPIINNKFSLPGVGRRLGGDLFYFPLTDKLFVANTNGLGSGYLTQFDYTTGVVEYDVVISPAISSVYGISAKNNELFLFEYATGNVYRLDDISIPTFTLVQTTIPGVGAASSDVSCTT